MVSLKIISFNTADSALNQYNKMLQNELIASEDTFLSYNRKTQRVDDFYFGTLKLEEKYPDLASVMIIIFVLTHGQAKRLQ